MPLEIREWAARIAVILAALTVLGILLAPLFVKPPASSPNSTTVLRKQSSTPASKAAGPRRRP